MTDPITLTDRELETAFRDAIDREDEGAIKLYGEAMRDRGLDF